MESNLQTSDVKLHEPTVTIAMRELGDAHDRWRIGRAAAAMVVGTLLGFVLWAIGTAVSWGMESIGQAALVGGGVGIWQGIRKQVIIPLAVACWVMGAMIATALFLRFDGTMIMPVSGVVAFILGATVARSVAWTVTNDDQTETVRSACLSGLLGAGVGWLLGATIAGTVVQFLEEPWCWTVVGASAGAIIGLLETNRLGVWLMIRQSVLKAIGGAVLVTFGFLGDGPFGWVAGASLLWMLTAIFFLPSEKHSDSVTCVAVAPDGDLALSCSKDGSARFWMLHDGSQIGYLQRKGFHAIRTVAFSHDGQFALAGREDGKLIAVDGSTGHELWSATASEGAVRCADVSFNDARVATGGEDGVVRLWDFESGDELRQFTANSAPVTGVAFAPHGPYILASDQSGGVRLWNLDNGVEIASFSEFTGPVHAVAFADDGQSFFAADDRAVHAFDLSGNKKLRSLEAHDGPVLSLAVYGGGVNLITGGNNGAVRLWDSGTGIQLGELSGHESAVNSIAVSDDGSAVVTGSADGAVCVAFLLEDSVDEPEESSDENDSPL